MTDEQFMGKWFAKVTKPQLDRYNQRMADAAPYRNSPRWERARCFAQVHFQYETTAARQLYERAMADLAAFDEVSEETNAMLTQFEVAEIFQSEAAE